MTSTVQLSTEIFSRLSLMNRSKALAYCDRRICEYWGAGLFHRMRAWVALRAEIEIAGQIANTNWAAINALEYRR